MCSIIFLCKKYETDGDAYQTKETERRSNAPFSGGGGGTPQILRPVLCSVGGVF